MKKKREKIGTERGNLCSAFSFKQLGMERNKRCENEVT